MSVIIASLGRSSFMQRSLLRLCHGLPAGLVLAASLAMPACSEDVAEFYKGRNVSLVIGYSVGGGYDAYGRLVARYLGKHIPGEPSVVPQNMTGAGSLRAANFLYTAAAKDGSVIGTFSRSLTIAPLLEKLDFDSRKFTWLGSVSDDTSLCVTRAESQVKTWDDLLTKPSTFGGLGAGSDPDIFALMYKNVFGAKIKLVSGYPGTNDVVLAMERAEVDGLCGLSWSTIKTRHAEWLKDKRVNLLVQAALKKEPDLAAVPLATELTKTTEQLQILKVILTAQTIARPFAAPPAIPAERRAALIAAFAETMKDAQFFAEAQRLKFDVRPVSAATIDGLLAEAYAFPKDVLAKAAQAISN
jgi:tripartite-type tricarboxylate transporter receptor subunit TctC